MRIGLLYAMKGEIESMLTEETPLLQEKAGVSFYRIREDIIACCGGVGKVNAAMATQLFIDLYHPDLMMNVGVAGSFEDLPIGTLVLPDRFMQHDMDTSGIGDPVGLISTVNRMDFPTARQDEARAASERHGHRLPRGQRGHRRLVRHGVRPRPLDRRHVPAPAHRDGGLCGGRCAGATM